MHALGAAGPVRRGRLRQRLPGRLAGVGELEQSRPSAPAGPGARAGAASARRRRRPTRRRRRPGPDPGRTRSRPARSAGTAIAAPSRQTATRRSSLTRSSLPYAGPSRRCRCRQAAARSRSGIGSDRGPSTRPIPRRPILRRPTPDAPGRAAAGARAAADAAARSRCWPRSTPSSTAPRRTIGARLREEAGPGGAAPDASTVYRTLELLERLGLVWHTHLGKGAPVYHAAEHPHLHVVCSSPAATSTRSTRPCWTAPRNVWRPTWVSRRRGPRRAVRDVPRVPRTSQGRRKPHERRTPVPPARWRGPPRAARWRPTTATRCASSAPLAEGAGLVDRSDRDVLAVPGADRLSWLHSLTSQHLDRLADGDRHRGAGPLAAGARGAPPGAGRPRRDDVGRRRARHRCGAAHLPRPDAVHASRRAGAGDRRVGRAAALVGPRAPRC